MIRDKGSGPIQLRDTQTSDPTLGMIMISIEFHRVVEVMCISLLFLAS